MKVYTSRENITFTPSGGEAVTLVTVGDSLVQMTSLVPSAQTEEASLIGQPYMYHAAGTGLSWSLTLSVYLRFGSASLAQQACEAHATALMLDRDGELYRETAFQVGYPLVAQNWSATLRSITPTLLESTANPELPNDAGQIWYSMQYDFILTHPDDVDITIPDWVTSDCLEDGTFDLTPRTTIVGGACLINGDDYFNNESTHYNGTYDIITTVEGNFSQMTSANRMFNACANLASWTALLPKLVTAQCMLQGTALTTWTTPLSQLEDGEYMFDAVPLTAWSIPLPKLNTGRYMYRNGALTSWSSATPLMTTANYMFHNCSLITFDGDLSALITGYHMFSNNDLTEWSIPLEVLETGGYMFRNNYDLTSFTVGLPSLDNAPWMFDNTSLTADSIVLIVNSLPEYSSGTHQIGFESVRALSYEHIWAAAAKGWTISDTPIGDYDEEGNFNTTPRAFVNAGAGLTSGNNLFNNSASYGNGDWDVLTTMAGTWTNMTSATNMCKDCINLSTYVCDMPSAQSLDSTWEGCTSLTYIDISLSSNAYYMWKSFKGCTALQSVCIANAQPTMAEGLFEGCIDLEVIDMNLSSIDWGNSLCKDCTSLTTITNPYFNTLRYAANAFDNTALTLACISNIIDSLPDMDGVEDAAGDPTSFGVIGFANVSAINADHIYCAESKGWTIVI